MKCFLNATCKNKYKINNSFFIIYCKVYWIRAVLNVLNMLLFLNLLSSEDTLLTYKRLFSSKRMLCLSTKCIFCLWAWTIHNKNYGHIARNETESMTFVAPHSDKRSGIALTCTRITTSVVNPSVKPQRPNPCRHSLLFCVVRLTLCVIVVLGEWILLFLTEIA